MGLTTYMFSEIVNGVLSDFDTNITHIGVGTDNTTPVVGDTTLNAEVDRNAEHSSNVSSNELQSQVRFDTSEANGNTLQEIGTFNASSSGTMYSHNLLTPLVKTSIKKAIFINVFRFEVK